jgi:hypothetical protein
MYNITNLLPSTFHHIVIKSKQNSLVEFMFSLEVAFRVLKYNLPTKYDEQEQKIKMH